MVKVLTKTALPGGAWGTNIMDFKSNSRALAIAATLVAWAAAVSPAAAGVVVFSNVSAAWSDPTPGSGITIANGSPTSTASWGTPALGAKQSRDRKRQR